MGNWWSTITWLLKKSQYGIPGLRSSQLPACPWKSRHGMLSKNMNMNKNMNFDNWRVKKLRFKFLFTCMHLTVSPRDLLPPTELLPWTNDLQMYQIHFFLLKINFEIVFLFYQLFPDSCVTVLISLCSSSPFCSKRIILRISFPKYLLKYLLDVKLSCFQCWCPLRGASFSSNWWSQPCKEGTKWVHVLRRKINQRGQRLQQKQGEESQLNGNCQHRKVITTMLRFIRTATVINNVRKNKNDLKWKSPNQQNWRKFIVKNNTALSS